MYRASKDHLSSSFRDQRGPKQKSNQYLNMNFPTKKTDRRRRHKLDAIENDLKTRRKKMTRMGNTGIIKQKGTRRECCRLSPAPAEQWRCTAPSPPRPRKRGFSPKPCPHQPLTNPTPDHPLLALCSFAWHQTRLKQAPIQRQLFPTALITDSSTQDKASHVLTSIKLTVCEKWGKPFHMLRCCSEISALGV